MLQMWKVGITAPFFWRQPLEFPANVPVLLSARLTAYAPTNILGGRDAQVGRHAPVHPHAAVGGRGGPVRCHRLRAAVADADDRPHDGLAGPPGASSSLSTRSRPRCPCRRAPARRCCATWSRCRGRCSSATSSPARPPSATERWARRSTTYRTRRLAELERERRAEANLIGAVVGAVAPPVRAGAAVSGPGGSATVTGEIESGGSRRRGRARVAAAASLPPGRHGRRRRAGSGGAGRVARRPVRADADRRPALAGCFGRGGAPGAGAPRRRRGRGARAPRGDPRRAGPARAGAARLAARIAAAPGRRPDGAGARAGGGAGPGGGGEPPPAGRRR